MKFTPTSSLENAAESNPGPTGGPGAPSRGLRAGTLIAGLLVLGACSGGGAGSGTSFVEGGSIGAKPNGNLFISDDHFQGKASNLQISVLRSGRLVDVYDRQPVPNNPGQFVERLQLTNFLIGEDVTSNGLDYRLDSNPVTGQENLVILYPVGSPAFNQALLDSEQNLTPLLTRGLTGASATPPFTAVPRNGAVSIQFNDLLDASTINSNSVQLLTGSPPSVPFELRLIPDPSHGAVVDGQFYTSRAILDFTVSTFESQQSGGSLPPNALGLPSATLVNSPNAVVRIPTQESIGQFSVLRNRTGHVLSFSGNGPTDPASTTLDVLRSFRSMGRTEITGDPNNGFLPDDIPPRILGAQAISLSGLNPVPGAEGEFTTSMTFSTPTCAMPARPGDVLQMPNNLAQVLSSGQLNVGSATVTGMRVRLLSGLTSQFVAGQGQFRSTWDPALGAPPNCFVRFDPLPGTLPSTDVQTTSNVIVSFSEPVDPATVQALDTFTLTYDVPPDPDPMWSKVVGRILPSSDLREYRFNPVVPLRHTTGNSEVFTVDVVGDDPTTGTVQNPEIEGITDLAGNPLVFDLTTIYGDTQNLVEFNVLATDATRDSGGIGFRFSSLDENLDGFPEIRGQYLIDTQRQVLKPRSVSRFSIVLDNQQQLIGAMPQSLAGVVTPLSNWGSRTMNLWRYIDMGFGLLDDNNHNLDIEALYWTPFTPTVQQDNFTEFQLAVAHGFPLPDETTNTGLLPVYRFSGMVEEFNMNLLDPDPQGTDPLTVIAPKVNGYFVDPQLTQTATTGIKIFPWPFNVNVALKDFIYWTWRDTAKTKLGGRTGGGAGPGADPQRLFQITQQGLVGFYTQGKLPTIALPLLTEFRCYPDTAAFGLNGFKTSFAINSSYRPTFRAFSTGGVVGTNITVVDPDASPTATGGINPMTGGSTQPVDNTVYWGQVDFVVRVSRMHTIWLDAKGASQFAEPVLEPNNTVQPVGTQVSVAFRGASNVFALNGTPWLDSQNYDPYGNSFTQAQLTALGNTTNPLLITYFPNPNGPLQKEWTNNISTLNGASWLQARVSFVSNAESDVSAELSALGFGFIK